MNKNKVNLGKTNNETYSEYNLRMERYNAMLAQHNTVINATFCVGEVLYTCQRLRNKLQTLNRRLLKIKAQNKALRAEIELLNHLLVMEKLSNTTEITVQMPEIKL